MAKKSAFSKGFRKAPKASSSSYSARDLKITIIGFAVIILAFVAVLTVPKIVENIGVLSVRNDVVQGVAENELICNTASSVAKAKYRHLCTVDPVDGYELSEVSTNPTDKRMPMFIYTPSADNAAAPAVKYFAMAGKGNAKELADQYADQVLKFGELLYNSEIINETLNGINTYRFCVNYRTNTSEDKDNPVWEYNQSAVIYMESKVNGRCVVLNATNAGESEESFGDQEAMLALLVEAAAKVTML